MKMNILKTLILVGIITLFANVQANLQSQPLNPDPDNMIPALPAAAQTEYQKTEVKCNLHLPDELFEDIGGACGRLEKERCCPVIAAWIYAARAPSALRTMAMPVSKDSPVLPDDSGACVTVLHNALKKRGIHLQNPNGTCDAIQCFCGIRVHSLSSRTCPQAFNVTSGKHKRVFPMAGFQQIEDDCQIKGQSGCSTCLRSLHQLNKMAEVEAVDDRASKLNSWDCELMGLTWLLGRNRSAYIATAVSVFRTFMFSDNSPDTSTCTVADRDRMPLPVDSTQLGDPRTEEFESLAAAARKVSFWSVLSSLCGSLIVHHVMKAVGLY